MLYLLSEMFYYVRNETHAYKLKFPEEQHIGAIHRDPSQKRKSENPPEHRKSN